jgi:RNA polymerase sigma-70 factor (ECF subfamily)
MTPSRAHLTVVAPDAPDDAALVDGVRANDPAMANALVRRVGPRAKACVRRLLRDRAAEHEDVLQLALLEIVVSLRRFRAQCSLDTWAERVTAHVVYKHLRRKRLERVLFDSLAEDAARAPPEDSPERRSLSASALRRIKTLLAPLDEEKVSLWLLFEVHGFSLEEIADIIGVSVAAAQSRISRTRREVRACLDADAELSAIFATVERAV